MSAAMPQSPDLELPCMHMSFGMLAKDSVRPGAPQMLNTGRCSGSIRLQGCSDGWESLIMIC
jgi:hypothetical protein